MKPLLVALDGSSHADASLPVAIGLARHLRTALREPGSILVVLGYVAGIALVYWRSVT